jgi:hypothetical protein
LNTWDWDLEKVLTQVHFVPVSIRDVSLKKLQKNPYIEIYQVRRKPFQVFVMKSTAKASDRKPLSRMPVATKP